MRECAYTPTIVSSFTLGALLGYQNFFWTHKIDLILYARQQRMSWQLPQHPAWATPAALGGSHKPIGATISSRPRRMSERWMLPCLAMKWIQSSSCMYFVVSVTKIGSRPFFSCQIRMGRCFFNLINDVSGPNHYCMPYEKGSLGGFFLCMQ